MYKIVIEPTNKAELTEIQVYKNFAESVQSDFVVEYVSGRNSTDSIVP